MELDIDVNKLQLLKSSYLKSHYRLEDMVLKTLPKRIEEAKAIYNNSLKDIETTKANPVRHNEDGTIAVNIRIGDKVYHDKEQAGEALKAEAAKALAQSEFKSGVIGSYRGFELKTFLDVLSGQIKVSIVGENSHNVSFGDSPSGNIQRIENAVNNIENRSVGYLDEVKKLESQLAEAKIEYEKPFPQEQELAEKLERKKIVDLELEKQNDDVKIDEKKEETQEQTQNQQTVQNENKKSTNDFSL